MPSQDSDRGSQYCYSKYINYLWSRGMRVRMTLSRDLRDNAIAERVNGILKNELMEHLARRTAPRPRMMLDEAVRICNEERLHMSMLFRVPAIAHELDYRLLQRSRNYCADVNPIQDNPTL